MNLTILEKPRTDELAIVSNSIVVLFGTKKTRLKTERNIETAMGRTAQRVPAAGSKSNQGFGRTIMRAFFPIDNNPTTSDVSADTTGIPW